MIDTTRALTLFTLLVLAGCDSQPRIDASSDKALKASLKKIDEKLTDKKRQELARATMVLMTREASDKAASTPAKESIYKSLDGMSADEIIAKANQQAVSATGKRE
jgi:hypothetical protein